MLEAGKENQKKLGYTVINNQPLHLTMACHCIVAMQGSAPCGLSGAQANGALPLGRF